MTETLCGNLRANVVGTGHEPDEQGQEREARGAHRSRGMRVAKPRHGTVLYKKYAEWNPSNCGDEHPRCTTVLSAMIGLPGPGRETGRIRACGSIFDMDRRAFFKDSLPGFGALPTE